MSRGNDDKMEVRITKQHTHAPRCEDAAAQEVKTNLKRKTVEQPEAYPATLIREELEGLSDTAIAV